MKNFSLKQKLIALCILISSFTLIVGGFGIFSLHKISGIAKELGDVKAPNMVTVGLINADTSDMSRYTNALIAFQNNGEEFTAFSKRLDDAIVDTRKNIKEYDEMPFSPGEEELYNKEVKGQYKVFEQNVLDVQKLLLTKNAKDREMALALFWHNLRPSGTELDTGLTHLVEFQKADGKKAAKNAEEVSKTTAIFSTIFMIGGTILGLFLGFVFSNSLSRSLSALAEKLSEGAGKVASASTQISSASTELSSSTTQQAAALQQTVAAVDEISSMVGKNSENAKSSQQKSASSKDIANHGREAVTDVISAIEEITQSNAHIVTQIESSNRETQQIVEVIKEIANKTKVINDIVFQTKLLSFNASVEAARAGEHGKGFAVVAEEVGNLAQMSGNAAQEITQMLEGSTKRVEEIVSSSKQKIDSLVAGGKQKVEVGTVKAQRCGEILQEIVTEVSSVNDLVGQIVTASEEQAKGIREITGAMQQLDQMTQQNASASTQSASAAEDMASQAVDLRNMVQSLKASIGGADSATESEPKAANVIQMKPKKIIQQKPRKPGKEEHSFHPQAKVRTARSSALGAVPSSDDPGFQEA